MGWCQDKVKHKKIFKMQYELVTSELKSLQIKSEVLEKNHIAQVQKVSDIQMNMKLLFRKLS